MLLAAPTFRPSRKLASFLLAVLCAACLAGGLPLTAHAQVSSGSNSLIAPAETKEQAKQAQDAAANAAASDSGGSIPLEVWLGIACVILIGGATFYMLRDSRGALVDQTRRNRPLASSGSGGTTRGAPRTMFEGEAAPGGKVGRTKKRAKSKRQKQARRANRPGR